MSKYFIWETRRTNEEHMLLPAFASTRSLGVSFIASRRFPEPLPELHIELDGAFGSTLTDDLVIMRRRCLVHSHLLRNVLSSVGVDNIDYYACRLGQSSSGRSTGSFSDEHGRERYRYKAANILDTIYCLDWNNSELEVDDEEPSEIWYIHDLKLLEDRLGDVLMFRLGEDPSIVIVHESVKIAVEASGVTGPVFLPADGYRDYPGYALNNPSNVIGTHDLDPFGPACDAPLPDSVVQL